MKRINLLCGYLLVALLVTQPAWAEKPWGLLKKTVEDTAFDTYAIDYLINERPIYYAVSKQITEKEKYIFINNIRAWPQQTLGFIKANGREKEFSDIIPYLERELKIQQVDPNSQPTIYLEIWPTYNQYETAVFEAKGEERPYSSVSINPAYRDEFALVSLHELGHFYGLGDQYGIHPDVHAENSSDVNGKDLSVMRGADLKVGRLTCDDADGFINLFDLRWAQSHNNRFPERAQNGWNSLCPGSTNVYKNAKTITRKNKDLFVEDQENAIALVSREYEQGDLVSEVSAYLIDPFQLFRISPSDTVVRNPQTGEIIYVMTRMKGEVNVPEANKGTQAELIWEKKFSYQRPEAEEKEGAVKVTVEELLNGSPIRQREIHISRDGSLKGDISAIITPTSYEAQSPAYNVKLDLKSRQIQRFVLADQNQHVRLEGDPKHGVVLTGERPSWYKLPLSSSASGEIKFYMDVYKFYQENLESFYQNFYGPVFERKNQALKEKQTVEKIKKSMRHNPSLMKL